MRAVILTTNEFAVYKSFGFYPHLSFCSLTDLLEIFQPMKAFLTAELYFDQVEKAEILLFEDGMERNKMD